MTNNSEIAILESIAVSLKDLTNHLENIDAAIDSIATTTSKIPDALAWIVEAIRDE